MVKTHWTLLSLQVSLPCVYRLGHLLLILCLDLRHIVISHHLNYSTDKSIWDPVVYTYTNTTLSIYVHTTHYLISLTKLLVITLIVSFCLVFLPDEDLMVLHIQ